MRTRLLPALATLLIVVTSEVRNHAQARFSENIVGFADVHFLAGSNLFANPFNAGDNSISNVLRVLPDGSVHLAWDKNLQTYPASNVFNAAVGWSNPTESLAIPTAGFLWLPASRTVAFAGDLGWTIPPPLPPCYHYPAGSSVTVLPVSFCGFCDPGPCPPVPDDTTACRWNRSRSAFECYTYYSFLGGWLTENGSIIDLQLPPGEAALIQAPQTFNGLLPNTITGGPASSVILTNAMRTDTQFLFRFQAAGGIGYTLLHSSNLTSASWTVAEQQIVQATNGYVTVQAPATQPGMAFYKLTAIAPVTRLFNAWRTNEHFEFQFYGALGTNYIVQRKNRVSDPSWMDVKNVMGTGGLMSVSDPAATSTNGLYRLRY